MITNLALQALELVDKGISVKVDNDQLVITREDGEKVRINCVYTKDEIDSIITAGTLPTDLQTLVLEALNEYIKTSTSVDKITWNEQLQQLSQTNITPNDILNLITTLSANDSNITESLQKYTTTDDVKTIINDRIETHNDTVSFVEYIKLYLETEFIPTYQSKLTQIDEETKDIKQAIIELKQNAIEGTSDFVVALPDGTNMTFTHEEVAKLMCMFINLSHANNNNLSDAIDEINKRQQTGLRVDADALDIIDSVPFKNDVSTYSPAPHIPTPKPDVLTDDYEPFQPKVDRFAKFATFYNDLCKLLNSIKPHIVKFAWRLYNGTYQLVAYVLETAY